MTREKREEGKVGMYGRLVVRKISSDGSEAVRVADDQRQSVTADLTPEGHASYEITGRSRQNEEGVLDVCAILAQRLRREGNPIGKPRMATGPERGIDCEIPNGAAVLQVQVTRPATPAFWAKLQHHATAERSISLAEVVEDLMNLVKKKARKASPSDRAGMVLVLDATETAVHAMPSVAQAVREHAGAEIAAYGFASVWVVGPSDDLVFKVDE